MSYRIEHDSMGEVRVPADRYWGAQTERSRNNFPIGAGREPMPAEIIRAFALLKKAAAAANRELKPAKMTEEKMAEPVREYIIGKTKLNPAAFRVKVIPEIPKNEAGKTLYRELAGYYA